MNRYHTSIPRAGLAIAAITLTALTLSVSVIAPARMDSSDALAAQRIAAPAAAEVVDVGRIDVIAVREPAFIPVHVQGVPAKHKQAS